MGLLALTLGLVACDGGAAGLDAGPDGNPDGNPDAAPPPDAPEVLGDFALTLRDENEPLAGVLVGFSRADGSPRGSVVTDASGHAQGMIATGDMVTVYLREFGAALRAITVTDLVAGEPLDLNTRHTIYFPTVQTAGQITVPIPAFAGADFYSVVTDCASAGGVSGTVTVDTCAGGNVAAYARRNLSPRASEVIATAFAVDVPLGGVASLGPWRSGQRAFDVVLTDPVPNPDLSVGISLKATRTNLFVGMVSAISPTYPLTLTVPQWDLPPDRWALYVQADYRAVVDSAYSIGRQSRTWQVDGAVPPDLTIALAASLPAQLQRPTVTTPAPFRDRLVWNQVLTDGSYTKLEHTTYGGFRIQWDVLMPPTATSFQFPQVPGEANEWIPWRTSAEAELTVVAQDGLPWDQVRVRPVTVVPGTMVAPEVATSLRFRAP